MLRDSERLETILQLTSLCDAAADQVALAHRLLHDEPEKADLALDHMEAALDCLKRCEAKR